MRVLDFCRLLLAAWFFCTATSGMAQGQGSIKQVFDQDWHDVFFLGDQLGWVYGYGKAAIAFTEDGGQQWQLLTILPGHEEDFYFEQIQFLNPTTGWLAGDYGHVYRTLDGGNTWQERSPQVNGRLRKAAAEGQSPAGVRIFYYGMHWFSESEGLVSGGGINFDKRSRESYLFHTKDAGETWDLVEQRPPDMLLNLFFLSRQLGYATSSERIYQTTDGGITWTQLFEDEQKTLGQIRGFFALDDQHLWACGFSGGTARSVDGGKTWATSGITGNRLRSLVFFNTNDGLMVGDQNKEARSLYQTRDGGRTWESVPEIDVDLHRIKKRGSRFFACGKKGTILVDTFPRE